LARRCCEGSSQYAYKTFTPLLGETDATSNIEEMGKVVQQDQVSTAIKVWIVCYSLYLILGMPISAIVNVVKKLLVSNIINLL
jgi:hypothetical protein